MRPADKVVGVLCSLIAIAFLSQSMYQFGYDEGRGFCRPAVKTEIKPMTHKQKVRAVKIMFRDSGVIL